jgi:hypothetical protein
MGCPEKAFPNLEKAITLFSEIGASERAKIVARIRDEQCNDPLLSAGKLPPYSWHF